MRQGSPTAYSTDSATRFFDIENLCALPKAVLTHGEPKPTTAGPIDSQLPLSTLGAANGGISAVRIKRPRAAIHITEFQRVTTDRLK